MTHICVSKLTIIGSDNGLLPGRRHAIIRTNAGILLIRPLGTNFSEFLVEILICSFKKMRLKVSSAKRRPFCLGLNELSPCVLMFLWNHEYVLTFSIISQDWYGAGSWSSSSWKTRTSLSHFVNAMLMMTWGHKVPGHLQPWYWQISWIFTHQQKKG